MHHIYGCRYKDSMKKFRALSLILAAALVVSSLTATPVSAGKTRNRVKLNTKKITLSVGQTKKVKVVPYKTKNLYETGHSLVTGKSSDGRYRAKVKWTSSNKKIARIVKSKVFVKKANVKVKGIAPGKATIKAKYKRRYLNVTLKFKVKVVPGGPAETAAPTTTGPVTSATPDVTAGVSTEAPTEAPTKAPTKVPTEVPTEAPTSAPTEVPTEAPPRDPVSLTFNADNIVVVNGGDGAKATVNEDGSVSFSNTEGFSGLMIPVPSDYVLNNGQSFYVNMDYTSTGSDARIYLVKDTVDSALSNIIGAAPSPLKGMMTATDDGVNYIFVKAATYDSLFTSLKINSIILSDDENATLPTQAPTSAPTDVPTEAPSAAPTNTPVPGNIIINGDFSDGKNGWTTNYVDNNLTVHEDEYGVVSGRWNNYSGVKYVVDGDFKTGDVINYSYLVKLEENYTSNGDISFATQISVAGSEGSWNVAKTEDGDTVYGTETEWTKVVGSYTVPSDTSSLTFLIAEGPGYNPDRKGTFYIDDLVAVVTSAVPDPTEAPTEVPTEAPTAVPTEVPTEAPTATPVPYEKAGEIKLDEVTFWDKLLNVITFGNYELPEPTVTITSDIPNAKISYYVVTDGETTALTEEQLDNLDASVWTAYTGTVTLTSEKNVVYAKILDPATGYVYYLCTDGITKVTETATPSPEPEPTPVTVNPVSDTYTVDGNEYDVYKYTVDTTDINMDENSVSITVFNDTRIEDFTFDLDMVNGYIEEYETIWDFADTISSKTSGSVTKYFGEGEASYTATGALTGSFHVKNGGLDKTADVQFEKTAEYITATIKFPATTYVATVTSAEKNKTIVVKNGLYNYYLDHTKKADGHTSSIITPSNYLAVFDKSGDVYSYYVSKDFVSDYNVSTEYLVEKY